MLTYNSGFYPVSLSELGVYPLFPPSGTTDNSTGLASKLVHNANYTKWWIFVKPGLKYSNGQAVTAQDVVGTYSPNFALNPLYDPIGIHSEITSETALNSTTALYTLNVSDAHLPEKMVAVIDSPILPSTIYSHGTNYTGLGPLPGDGPFYIANYSVGQTQVIMQRNPYWSPAPGPCEIDWNFVETLSQTATYLQSGYTDMAEVVPGVVPALLTNPNIHILRQSGLESTPMLWNTSLYPYNMTAFRQAIAYGVNQSEILQRALYGYGTTAYNAQGTVAPLSKWYNPNQVVYSYNTNKSLQLLKSIGITKGGDGHLQYKNGTDVTLSIWADSDFTWDTVTGQVVTFDLQTLGFKVNLHVTTIANFYAYGFTNQFGIDHSMVFYSTDAYLAGSAWANSAPIGEIYGPPFFAPKFDIPNDKVARAEYLSNFTALLGTSNPILEKKYLDNIQVIYSQNLPALILGFPDHLLAYSTQRWTHWPTQYLLYAGVWWNDSAISNLQPISVSPSTTSSASATSTNSTSVSPPPSSGLSTTTIAIVIAAVIVAGLVGVVIGRRRPTASKPAQ
jgi:peptide/nickel transport system substrate-binding protein